MEIGNQIYNGHGCRMDIYLPDSPGFGTIVYFHGGGLKEGDKRDANILSIKDSFLAEGYAFLSVNYRMYPDAKFPDYLHDAADAVKYAMETMPSHGGNGSYTVSGQSAGAWMALMLAMDKKYLENAGISVMDISSWIIESAEPLSHFNVLTEEKGLDPRLQRIDEYAPLYFLDGNTAFRDMLLIYYSEDMLIRKYQNILFYQAVKQFDATLPLTPLELEGYHCKGSTMKDPDGEYPFVKESLKWLKSIAGRNAKSCD